jgi:hypothetical protein
MTFRFITANSTTLPIIADAGPTLMAAIELLLEGVALLEIPHDELDRDDRRALLIIRDNLITI